LEEAIYVAYLVDFSFMAVLLLHLWPLTRRALVPVAEARPDSFATALDAYSDGSEC